MLILTVYFIDCIFNKKALKSISAIMILFILLLSVKRPVKEILFSSDSNYPVFWIFNSLKHPFYTMRIFYRTDVELNKVIKELKSKKLLNGNIASLKTKKLDRDPYSKTLRISQENNCSYYGQIDDTKNLQVQKDELNKMCINYLITWDNVEWGDASPLYYNYEAGVRVYTLK